jgi:hypothetical protein
MAEAVYSHVARHRAFFDWLTVALPRRIFGRCR